MCFHTNFFKNGKKFSSENLQINFKSHTMSKKPKISVIIPVFNQEKYLSRCLRSLIDQTLEKKIMK